MAASSPHSTWPLQNKQREASTIATIDAAKREARLDDPFHRLYRGPLARLLTRGLARLPVLPTHLVVAQPFLGAIAGYLLTFADTQHLAIAALLFEVRSILGSVAEALARSRGLTDPRDRAEARAANRLSAAFFYVGIAWHVHLHVTPTSGLDVGLSTTLVVALALFQALARDLAFAHYTPKLADTLSQAKGALPAQRIALIWSVSGVETCSSLLVLALLSGGLWASLLFFATAGVAWIAAAIFITRWLLAHQSRQLTAA